MLPKCYVITMLRSDKDEPHQKHRLRTISNNITSELKQLLRDPNPCPGSWYGSCALL